MVAGQHIWSQIEKIISKDPIDGWAILHTENSLKSTACMEEYQMAINRMLKQNPKMPLIGLLHNISFKDVPAMLQTRLCLQLSDNAYAEKIKAALENQALASSAEVQDKHIGTYVLIQTNYL